MKLKDYEYPNVIAKVMSTPWLITPEGMETILEIINLRANGQAFTDEEIRIRLEAAERDRDTAKRYEIAGGVGVLPLHGSIFPKANLLTMLSGSSSLEMFKSDFREMLANDDIKSIVLDIDSPGGTSDLVAEVGQEIYNGRQIKPIHAVANTMAASAAYWLGSQATKLHVTPSGKVGSIGVYTVHKDNSQRNEALGTKVTYISAGRYKTAGNSDEPLSQDAKDYIQESVDECYNDFVAAVANGRGIEVSEVLGNFGQGKTVSAKTALQNNMVDSISTIDEVIDGMYIPSGVSFGGSQFADSMDLKWNMESKEWEHSEPGTGSPPAPRTDEDGSDDPAITQKWRRSPLPLDKNAPGAPKAEGVEIMNEEQLKELAQLLNLNADADADTIVEAAKNMFSEVKQLREDVGLSAEERRFANEFPHMYAEHKAQKQEIDTNKAIAFCNSIERVTRPEGDKAIDTGFGLSALAKDEITAVHKKFSEGIVTREDFENVITRIMHGGVVKFGEEGSAVPKPDEAFVIDTSNTAAGVQANRKLFATKIEEIMHEDKVDFSAARKLAAERFPELAAAYRVSAPA